MPTKTIRDIIPDDMAPVKFIKSGSPLRQTIDYLAEKKIGCALVIDAEGGLAGVISERDVVRAIYEHGGDALDYATDSYMAKDVITCSIEEEIASVARLMSSHNFRHLPIIDDGYLAGMISMRDLMDALTPDA
jgi:CBS domain-containing protein